MTLVKAVISTQDEEAHLLGLLDSLHAVSTESHNKPEELEAFHRLTAPERTIAEAHRLDPIKLSIGYTRDKSGEWHVTRRIHLRTRKKRVFVAWVDVLLPPYVASLAPLRVHRSILGRA